MANHHWITLGEESRWLDLAALGRDAWNMWADSELKKPAAQRATVELGGSKINQTNWGGFKFPGRAHFNNAIFVGEAHFAEAHFFALAWFAGSTFPRSSNATFADAVFLDRADFKQCVFNGVNFFHNVRFESDASFNGARFKGSVQFHDTIFAGAVDFCRARFCDNAGFGHAVFSTDARFINAMFCLTATFDQASGDGFVRFNGAQFAQPPDFTTSNLTHAPSFLDTVFDFYKAPDAHARYRRLKKYASDDQDHRGELNLFALETKALRGYRLKWTRPQDWLELVLNYLYEIVSDYGRSVLRPLVAVAITFLIAVWRFALLAGQFDAPWKWKDSVWVAGFLNLIPFAGQSEIGRRVMETAICPQVNLVSSPYCLASIYRIGAIEGVVAVIFLFLLVLGVRNLFRIK
ncbi:MAG TPA: pentapeptide repeat-containing protein [Bryobacteraceae bacterium]|nr:pentapeptide repeat-containing protein [Bryobacteraceae bacterium]